MAIMIKIVFVLGYFKTYQLRHAGDVSMDLKNQYSKKITNRSNI